MAKKSAKTPQTDRIALIDELGALEIELAELKGKEARAKAIRELLRKEAVEFPDHMSVMFDGIRYAVQLSPKENERTILNKWTVFEAVGLDVFVSIATIPLGKLDEALPHAEASGLVKKERTGSRTVTTM